MPAAVAAFGLLGFFVAIAALAAPRLRSVSQSIPSVTPSAGTPVPANSSPTATPTVAGIHLLNSSGRLVEFCEGDQNQEPDKNWRELATGQETTVTLSHPGRLIYMRYPGEKFHYGTELDTSRLWAITNQVMKLNDGGSFPLPGILDVNTGQIKDGSVGGL